jgi:hypothetical protein
LCETSARCKTKGVSLHYNSWWRSQNNHAQQQQVLTVFFLACQLLTVPLGKQLTLSRKICRATVKHELQCNATQLHINSLMMAKE